MSPKRLISDLTTFLAGLVLSRTARNTYLVFLGNGLSAFFAFIFTVTLVRQLTFADFGYFSALLSFLLLVSDLADIGIGSSLSAFLPPLATQKNRLFSFLRTAFFLQFIIAAFSSTVIFLFSSLISDVLFHDRELDFLIKITSLGIFTAIMSNFYQYALLAIQKFLQVAFLSAFGGLSRLLLLVILIAASGVVLTNIVWMQVLAYIILALVAFLVLDYDYLKVKKTPGDFKKLMSFTYFLGIARGLTALASRLDVLMLIAMTNATNAGIYSIASRVISIYPLLTGSFSAVIAPKLSSATDKHFLKKYIYKVILATIGLIVTALIMIIIAYPFITILFGQKAAPAVGVFRVLLVAMIFFIGSIPSVALAIYYLRKPYILTVNSVIQLVIVIVGNLYFIPRFGLLGPAYSLILAYGITLFFTSFLSYYYLRLKHAE